MGCSEGQAGLAKAVAALNKANQAYNIAVGLVYVAESYSALVTDLNSKAKNKYVLGASIFVKTVEVPDLWFVAVNESSSVPYTYTTDAQFIADLNSNPTGLQIGHYKVCILEGAKFPLNDVKINGVTCIDANGIAQITDAALSQVKYVAQNLSAAQKVQARANIGAWTGSEYDSTATDYPANTFFYTIEVD